MVGSDKVRFRFKFRFRGFGSFKIDETFQPSPYGSFRIANCFSYITVLTSDGPARWLGFFRGVFLVYRRLEVTGL